MYPDEHEAALVAAAEALMVETMARYDPSHDAYHGTQQNTLPIPQFSHNQHYYIVQRVRRTSLSLARALTPTPDLLVVEVAALLHDVLDKKYVSAEIASDPYKFFLPFFSKHATSLLDLVSDGRARVVTDIVHSVSWTTEKKLRAEGRWGQWHEGCRELHCVQDADRLDAIGAFGILRCAAFSAATNRCVPIYLPLDISAVFIICR